MMFLLSAITCVGGRPTMPETPIREPMSPEGSSRPLSADSGTPFGPVDCASDDEQPAIRTATAMIGDKTRTLKAFSDNVFHAT